MGWDEPRLRGSSQDWQEVESRGLEAAWWEQWPENERARNHLNKACGGNNPEWGESSCWGGEVQQSSGNETARCLGDGSKLWWGRSHELASGGQSHYKFLFQAVHDVLLSSFHLHCWGLVDTPVHSDHSASKGKGTLEHILSCSAKALGEGWYHWWHNQVRHHLQCHHQLVEVNKTHKANHQLHQSWREAENNTYSNIKASQHCIGLAVRSLMMCPSLASQDDIMTIKTQNKTKTQIKTRSKGS